jgi:Protein of unknown function (DUF1566)
MNTQKRKLIAAVSLCAAIAIPTLASAASISGQGTWETTLQGRDFDGNLATFEAYYDTSLNITWLANANYAGTTMTWSLANTWAANLNPYGSGITGWRLPTVSPIDGTTTDDGKFAYNGSEDRGYNVSAPGTLYAGSTASEMAHMFYNTLCDKGSCNPTTSTVTSCMGQTGYGLSNAGPFSNLQSSIYWSATEYAPNTNYAWPFTFYDGEQINGNKAHSFYAWAVHAGDVGASAVPVPAAAWLFGSGLLGLIGMGRRKAT